MFALESNPNYDEFARTCVVAIQGGGVYGLSLLGQLQAVYDAKLQPIAFAGTSAGAIIAALCWAGYSPDELRQLFAMFADSGELLGLLGNSKGHSALELKQVLDVLREHPQGKNKCLWFLYLVARCGFLRKIWHRFDRKGGLFCGQKLEDFIDRMICGAPRFRDHVSRLPPRKVLTLGDIQRWVEKDYVDIPPLYAVVTNLTRRTPELVDSTDRKFADMPIAKVIRASAGFPVIFDPMRIASASSRDIFADGGIVLNFPAFVFTKNFRKARLNRPRLPHAMVGLQLAPAPVGPQVGARGCDVVKSLFKLLTGESRNWLERQLAGACAHPIMVSQPIDQTQAPSNVMGLDELNGNRVNTMFDAARSYAAGILGRHSFRLPTGPAARPIFEALRTLINQAGSILGVANPAEDQKIRANVFVACPGAASVKLALKYSVNMNSPADTDRNMVFEVGQGLTGVVFLRRQVLACDLEEVRKAMEAKDPGVLETFRMTPELQKLVRPDRQLLMSSPVPDMSDLAASLADLGLGSGSMPAGDELLQRITFGIVNLDTSVRVDLTEPANEPRLDALASSVLLCAFRVGLVFTEAFAGG